jgi:hypothetical protein
MEENKVLFQVTNENGGSTVNCHIDGQEEAFAVALAIYQVIQGSPLVACMLASIIEMRKNDPEFDKVLDESTIDMPDFEAILKNTK